MTADTDQVSNAEEVIQTPTAPVDSDVSEEPGPAEADAQVDRIGDRDDMTLDYDPTPATMEMAAATEAPELNEETDSGDFADLANTIEFSLDDGLPGDDDDAIAESSDSTGADASDIEGKLDLARAYVEIGDKAAAIELLDEIEQQGTSVQKEAADVLRKELLG